MCVCVCVCARARVCVRDPSFTTQVNDVLCPLLGLLRADLPHPVCCQALCRGYQIRNRPVRCCANRAQCVPPSLPSSPLSTLSLLLSFALSLSLVSCHLPADSHLAADTLQVPGEEQRPIPRGCARNALRERINIHQLALQCAVAKFSLLPHPLLPLLVLKTTLAPCSSFRQTALTRSLPSLTPLLGSSPLCTLAFRANSKSMQLLVSISRL